LSFIVLITILLKAMFIIECNMTDGTKKNICVDFQIK